MWNEFQKDVQRYFHNEYKYGKCHMLYCALRHPTLQIIFLGRLSKGGGTFKDCKTAYEKKWN